MVTAARRAYNIMVALVGTSDCKSLDASMRHGAVGACLRSSSWWLCNLVPQFCNKAAAQYVCSTV
jgi:hypothetical protein